MSRVDITRNNHHCRQTFAGIGVKLVWVGDRISAHWNEVEQVGVLNGASIAAGLVNDRHILGLAALMIEVADADGQQDARNHQDGDEYGHDDERLASHHRHVFAGDNQFKLAHGSGLLRC